jgi:transglutaminase-like putative cysteine protease
MVPLIIALCVALVPHALQLPVWIVLWCLACWSYMLAVAKFRWPQPGKAIRLILTTAGILMVLLASSEGLNRYSSVALLWIMASIKPLEIQSLRDEIVTVFMTYFLAVCGLFFSNSFALGICITISLGVTTAALICINYPAGKFSANLGLSARLILKALPLALILFTVFPRIQGGLWGIRSDMTAVSGFSDKLAPGSVTRLVRNNTVAFRVKFNSPIPPAERLYWRGLVFWQFDGRAWHAGDDTVNAALPVAGRNVAEYAVTLEPHNHRWLFALDLPFQAGSDIMMMSDQTLRSRRPVERRIQYQLKSYTSYNTGRLREWETVALKIPRDRNPEALALARKWRREAATPEKLIGTALDYFRTGEFGYTLNPPPLGEESVDDFLFRTRKGYCGHYASAFVFLMRAAGIPTRLVAGYLGGELNPYGEYMIVRQSDAHVWAEVWLPSKGWVRTDPTLAVAPERVAQGLAAVLPLEERSTIGSLVAWGPYAKYWIKIRLGWDAVNNQWNKWVISYSSSKQKSLLAKFGLRPGSRSGWAAAIIPAAALICGIGLCYFIGFSKKKAARPDSVQQSYLKFCHKLERIGLYRKPFIGPQDFAAMVLASRADLKPKALEIINLYIKLRYGRGGQKAEAMRLKRLVKQFDPNSG